MKTKNFPLFFALAILICGERGFAYSAQVENILARDYFDVVRREMGKATSSISISMYSFTLRPHLSDSPVFALAQSLKQADDRGVRVEMILDQRFPPGDRDGPLLNRRWRAVTGGPPGFLAKGPPGYVAKTSWRWNWRLLPTVPLPAFRAFTRSIPSTTRRSGPRNGMSS